MVILAPCHCLSGGVERVVTVPRVRDCGCGGWAAARFAITEFRHRTGSPLQRGTGPVAKVDYWSGGKGLLTQNCCDGDIGVTAAP